MVENTKKLPSFTGKSSEIRKSVLLLDAAQIQQLLSPEVCLKALQDMYRNLHASPDDKGMSLGFETVDGKIHVKAGLSPATHRYFAAKVNANFPGNPGQGLLTIQGLLVLVSAENGQPLAILQSGVLTGIRTAAASAMAAHYGARDQAKSLAVVGCGAQALFQINAMLGVRDIEKIALFDIDPDRAHGLRGQIDFDGDVLVSPSLGEVVRDADICVTCTTASKPFLSRSMVKEGCFIAAVGADNPDKNEIAADLFRETNLIVDDAAQCAKSGDLAHAIRAGFKADKPITLAELASGSRAARKHEGDIVLFDSTGVGVQDVAAAAAVYERAITHGVGLQLEMEP